MKKIMISQPMNGLTEEQITNAQNKFLEYAKKENLEALNTYFKDEWCDQCCGSVVLPGSEKLNNAVNLIISGAVFSVGNCKFMQPI